MIFDVVSYSQIKSKLSPLDLILFKGTDIISDTIRFFEKDELNSGLFSHCGLLVNSEILPTIKQLIPGRWYVWESTMSATHGLLSYFSDGVPNAITGTGKLGVQIRDLEDVIDAYLKSKDSAIAWCKLKNNPWYQQSGEWYLMYLNRKRKLIKTVTDTHLLYGNRTYDCNIIDLFGAIFPFLRIPRDVFDESLVEGQ